MTKIIRSIEDDDIDWEYLQTHAEGKTLPEPRNKKCFEADQALALMIINNVVFINSWWWRDDWPEEAKKMVSVHVNCSDIFMWACSEGEDLPHSEIENLYRMWRKDPEWGPAVWCMIQRKLMPQKPVENLIRRAGIWDLDSLGLEPNKAG